jgi:hypothetical protein
LPWNVLENKFDYSEYFASSGHGVYKNPNCRLDIRSAGITHLMHNPELYIEDITWRRKDMPFIFEW